MNINNIPVADGSPAESSLMARDPKMYLEFKKFATSVFQVLVDQGFQAVVSFSSDMHDCMWTVSIRDINKNTLSTVTFKKMNDMLMCSEPCNDIMFKAGVDDPTPHVYAVADRMLQEILNEY